MARQRTAWVAGGRRTLDSYFREIQRYTLDPKAQGFAVLWWWACYWWQHLTRRG